MRDVLLLCWVGRGRWCGRWVGGFEAVAGAVADAAGAVGVIVVCCWER